MAGESFGMRVRENASGIAATVITGTWLAMLMLDFPSGLWLAVMLFGYIAVIPVVSMLFDEEDEADESEWTGAAGTGGAEEETPLEKLRRRYAEGELTDEQFERKLERLLETETLEDVEKSSQYPDREQYREKEIE